jgi:DNA-binding protein HU-beta
MPNGVPPRTRQYVVGQVAAKSDLPLGDAARAVNAILDTITESLSRDEAVMFSGFGKFSTQRRAARQGVNPRNPSQKVQIPAAAVPRFSAGSQLKQAVRKSSPQSARHTTSTEISQARSRSA